MKNQVSGPPNSQAGSVIILIFIAIALFVAVSFAITRGFRGGVGKIGGETAKVSAQDILNYGQSVRDGVKTLLVNGVPLEKISFEMTQGKNTDGSSDPTANSACTDDTCKVFKPTGGNVPEMFFYDDSVTPSWWQPGYTHPGGLEPNLFNINGVGTSASDLVLKILRVKPEICQAVNNLAGIADSATTYDEDQTGTSSYVYGAADTDTQLAATDAQKYGYAQPVFAGKKFFCVGDHLAPGDGGDVVIVLYAR